MTLISGPISDVSVTGKEKDKGYAVWTRVLNDYPDYYQAKSGAVSLSDGEGAVLAGAGMDDGDPGAGRAR